MTDTESEIVEEYPHGCRIVREVDETGEPRFHYRGVFKRMQSFASLEKARLYADVDTVAAGFREEKTGERGIPPVIAQSRVDVQAAYMASQPTMGVTWAAQFLDADEELIRDYIHMVQKRAREERASEEGTPIVDDEEDTTTYHGPTGEAGKSGFTLDDG